MYKEEGILSATKRILEIFHPRVLTGQKNAFYPFLASGLWPPGLPGG